MAPRKEEEKKVEVGNISEVSGEVNIAGGDLYKGYTAQQVSVLLTQISSTFQPKPFDGRCPYKGLDVFEEEDAGLFFGRERLVDDLVNRVKESRTVFITGPSGSGKSSLVRAGLIHALKQGAIKNSERWLYETMKPGRDPIEALASMLSRLKSPELGNYFRQHVDQSNVLHECAESALSDRRDQRLVLFVDQFEEIFTQISNEAERVSFLDLLTHAATTEDGRVTVLFSMRSDFVANCATYPQVNALLNQQFLQIGAMQPDELVSAIAQPALRVGLRIDPDLVAQIINDMQGEPGTLPLMQFALKDLFDSQQSKDGVIALTLNDYLQRGGIRKSLERHADDAFTNLTENEQVLARSIFTGLIEIGRGTQDTRRTALFDELIPASVKPEDVEAIVQKLADARLITTDEQAGKDTVTISHEKLIDAWPWLKKLVNENRDAIALQNEIASDAKEWEEHQHDTSYLYTGARLASAREKLSANKIVLSGLAQLFIETGARAYADELERAKQSAIQLRRRSVYLSMALVVALIAVGVAVFFGIQSQQQTKIAQSNAKEAQKQTSIAFARQLAALSVAHRSTHLDLSFLLSLEAFRHAEKAGIPEEGPASILGALVNQPSLVAFLNGDDDWVFNTEFSPDGKILASSGRGGSIVLWDPISEQQIMRLVAGQGIVYDVAFSADGKTIASAGSDGSILLWDVISGKQLGTPLLLHTNSVNTVAFSPDDSILASGGYDGAVILWDVASHQPIGAPLTSTLGWINGVAFSPDGKLLAVGSGYENIYLYEVNDHHQLDQPLVGHSLGVQSVAFSPDGTILASGSNDKTIILWDMASFRQIGTPLIGHTKGVSSLSFSPDGKTLVSGSGDKSILLWDVTSHREIGAPLSGHTDGILSVDFSPDGHTVVAGSIDTTITLWDVSRHQRLGVPLLGNTKEVYSLTFHPDGSLLASGGWDNSVRLWDVIHRKLLNTPFTGHREGVNSVAFSTDGNILASGGFDNTVILWDLANNRQLGEPFTVPAGSGTSSYIYSLAFSPDGKTLAISRDDTSVVLWDIAGHKQIGSPLITSTNGAFICCPAVGAALAFSLDGKILASGSGYTDGIIVLWDVASQQQLGSTLIGHTGPVYSVAFSPDGKTLASASNDKRIILWDIANHKQVGAPLTGHTGPVNSVAFSPDGKTLASGGADNNIILWDVASHKPLGDPLTGHFGTVISVAFSPDGKTVASGSEDTNIILWDVDPDSWKEQICKIAGRNFTRAEWAQYFPNEEYRKTCEQWPLEPEATPIPSPTP